MFMGGVSSLITNDFNKILTLFYHPAYGVDAHEHGKYYFGESCRGPPI